MKQPLYQPIVKYALYGMVVITGLYYIGTGQLVPVTILLLTLSSLPVNSHLYNRIFTLDLSGFVKGNSRSIKKSSYNQHLWKMKSLSI